MNILCNFACFIVSVEFINSSLILLGEPEALSILTSMVPWAGVRVGRNMGSLLTYKEEGGTRVFEPTLNCIRAIGEEDSLDASPNPAEFQLFFDSRWGSHRTLHKMQQGISLEKTRGGRWHIIGLPRIFPGRHIRMRGKSAGKAKGKRKRERKKYFLVKVRMNHMGILASKCRLTLIYK